MTEAFTKWDVTEHLRTREDARLYLEACAEEDPGDGSLIRAALNDIARAGNMSQLARDVGMSREGLYKALSEDGNPSFRDGDAGHAGVGLAGSHHGVAAAPRRRLSPPLALIDAARGVAPMRLAMAFHTGPWRASGPASAWAISCRIVSLISASSASSAWVRPTRITRSW